jgi:isopenicillin-N epimerase
MTSRRQFLKGAGALTGVAALPVLGLASTSLTSKSPDFSLAKTDDELFALVRAQLLIPENRIYLNTGSLGPSPVTIIDAVHGAMRQLESNPVDENWGELGKSMEAVREKIAGFINADKEEILLTRNTTEGLSLISSSVELKSGDEILTTTQEHGGALAGMQFAEKHKGVVIKKVAIPYPAQSTEEVVAAVSKGITSKTKMVVLSHVNTVTGLVMPIAEITKLAKSKGIILVADGAQAAGLIKVDVKALGVDAYAASGHKWLMGPKETGFLYLNKDFTPRVQNVFTSSSMAAYSASSGTRNVAVIIGLGAAIDFHQEIGVEKIQERCLEIRNYCKTELEKVGGLKITSPASNQLSCGIVCFALEKAANRAVFTKLREQDIITKLLPGANDLRISCHMFVSKGDIDRFIQAFRSLTG